MAAVAKTSPVPYLPHIHMLCMDERCAQAFEAAAKKFSLPECATYTMHDTALAQVPGAPEVQFDAVVSPANSYARLDGGFDDAISRSFSPPDDYLALTRACQAELYERYRGFAPPGTCTLVRMADELIARTPRNVWGTRYVALCPTMRRPQDVRWDREISYECVWSLLCAVDGHNRRVREASEAPGRDPEEIRSMLMTPFGTGAGDVSPETWASQAVVAIRHFVEACEKPEAWSQLEWPAVFNLAKEIEETWPESSRSRKDYAR